MPGNAMPQVLRHIAFSATGDEDKSAGSTLQCSKGGRSYAGEVGGAAEAKGEQANDLQRAAGKASGREGAQIPDKMQEIGQASGEGNFPASFPYNCNLHNVHVTRDRRQNVLCQRTFCHSNSRIIFNHRHSTAETSCPLQQLVYMAICS
jgi:hypothetical protein